MTALTLRTDDKLTATPLTQELKNRWGGKGAGLVSMASAGLPVPEALVIGTEAWSNWRSGDGMLDVEVMLAVKDFIEAHPGALFSVRSGAPISMPGMMDTVLNLGATPDLSATHNRAYERFAEAWLKIVHGIPEPQIERVFATARERAGKDEKRFARCLSMLIAKSYVALPETRYTQALACIEAVFRSWDTERARAYRAMHSISDDMGTACVVQRMVFGNAPGFSGTGVMFSRDPATGADKLTGEIAFNAQGEDVVSGAVTPMQITKLVCGFDLYKALNDLAAKLETAYGDVQDIEFTVERGALYVLQTRTAKMSARARIETACALAAKLHVGSLAAQHDYIRARVTPATVAASRVPTVNAGSPAATGLAASPGAVVGRVVLRSTPLDQIDKGCILVAHDTAPEDFPRMAAAGAIFTAVGGFTCHSAVVARGIGVPAVVGCEALTVSKIGGLVGSAKFAEGDVITLCGTTGRVWTGAQPVEATKTPTCLLTHLAAVATGLHGGGAWVYDFALDGCLGTVVRANAIDHAAVAAACERVSRLKARGYNAVLQLYSPAAEDDVYPTALNAAIEKGAALAGDTPRFTGGAPVIDLITLLEESTC